MDKNNISVDVTKARDSAGVCLLRCEQVRKHKKRRLNKKWAKRYGYRFVNLL